MRRILWHILSKPLLKSIRTIAVTLSVVSIVGSLLSTLHASAYRIFALWGQRISIGSGCVGSLFFLSWAAALVSCVAARRSLMRVANWRITRDCSQFKKKLQRRLFVTQLSKGKYFVSFTVVILYLFVSFSKFIKHRELKNLNMIIICYKVSQTV